MLRYIAKRVLSAIITIWFIMTLTFVLMNAIPGDPFASEKMNDPVIIANMKAKYGLDKPFIEQYGTYMRNYMHGDFGISFMKKGITTNDIISAGFPYSLAIGIWASLVILGFGIFFGIIAALRQNKFVDRVLMVLSTLGATIPSFVFATGFLYLFSKILGWVPSFGVNSWKGYVGCSEPGLYPYGKSKGTSGMEGTWKTCIEECLASGCNLHRTDVCGFDHRIFRSRKGIWYSWYWKLVYKQYS